MPVLPYFYVEAPQVERYRHGLLDVAPVVEQPSDHWQYSGVEFESFACYLSATYPGGLNDCNGAGGTKVLPACLGVTQASSFAVYGGVSSGSLGHNADDNAWWTDRARRIVENGAQHAVESALWTGTAGATPAFNAATTAKVIGGQANTTVGAVDLATGVAACENYLANNYAGRGVIHMPRGAGIHMSRLQLLKAEPDRPEQYCTPLGTRLVFGGGYDGTGPAAVTPPAGTATTSYFWVYVTGAVMLMAGQIEQPGGFAAALDRAGNQVKLYAEQPWLAAVDCLQAGVLVGTGATIDGGAP